MSPKLAIDYREDHSSKYQFDHIIIFTFIICNEFYSIRSLIVGGASRTTWMMIKLNHNCDNKSAVAFDKQEINNNFIGHI